MQSSGDADGLFPGQFPSQSHTHAMSQSGEDENAAKKKWGEFLRDQQKAARACSADSNSSLYEFGKGLHAVADSTSPSHEGFQPWSLNPLGMLPHHLAEKSMNLADYNRTIRLMRNYYQSTYGSTAW